MLHTILAIIPFLIIVYFIVFKEYKAYKVMLATYILTFLMLIFFWQLSSFIALSASLRGLFIALEIFLIIFSVLLLFNLLKETNRLEILKDYLKNIAKEKHIEIIIIGFFIVTFFEAIAGFGTPAAIAAPLLVFLGLRPLTAIIITLVSDSLAVVFGAFGTPVIYGLGSTVGTDLIPEVTYLIGIIVSIIAVFTPLFLIFLYKVLEGKKTFSIKKAIPFSLFSGLAFAIPFFLSAKYLSAEMPSLLASVIGLVLVLISLKIGFFSTNDHKHKNNVGQIITSFAPYILLIFLLIFSRLNLLNFGDFLKSIGFTLNFANDISFSFSLYSPGVLIMLAFLIFAPIFIHKSRLFTSITKTSFNQGSGALLALIFILGFVQLLIYSSNNSLDIPGIPVLIANMFSSFGIFYILFAPLIGAFGSFIAGSGTVSNLLFSNVQANAAVLNGLPNSLILALQTVGAGIGNMIAIHNLVAVLAIVPLKNGISKIIKVNILIVLGVSLITSLIGYIILYLMF